MLQASLTQSGSGGTRLEPGARKDYENNDNRNVNNEMLLAINNSLGRRKKKRKKVGWRGGGWDGGVGGGAVETIFDLWSSRCDRMRLAGR